MFSGDRTECWDDYIAIFIQMASDYRLFDKQKLQYSQTTFSDDALQFNTSVVGPNAFKLQWGREFH